MLIIVKEDISRISLSTASDVERCKKGFEVPVIIHQPLLAYLSQFLDIKEQTWYASHYFLLYFSPTPHGVFLLPTHYRCSPIDG